MSGRPARVAFDARLYGAPPTGIGRWTHGLLPALVEAAPERQWIALGPTDALADLVGRYDNLSALDAHPRRNLVWQLTRLPGLLREARADAFVSPWNLVTSRAFAGVQLPWLHDLIPFEATVHGFRATYRYKTLLTLAMARRQASGLVVVSQFTGTETVARLGLARDRIHVVNPAVGSAFGPQDAGVVDACRDRHQLPARYVFSLGGAEPRKNLRMLLDAWRALPAEARGDAVLALAGHDFRGEGLTPDDEAGVRWLGRVPEDDLPALYAGALRFVYPSLSEGFGLPPLEAMACRTAVIASDATSIPEATGGCATLVPTTTDAFTSALADALAGALAGDEPVDQLERGATHAARYTWAASAAKVLAALDAAAARSRGLD